MRSIHPFLALPLLTGVLWCAALAEPAATNGSELDELKAVVMAMQKAIAEQNAQLAAQSARIATLEKQRPQTDQARTMAAGAGGGGAVAGAANSPTNAAPGADRSMVVAGYHVPLGPLPTEVIPAERTLVRDADTFLNQQQAAPRPNNAPLDPELKGFIAIPGTDTVFKIGGSARLDLIGDLGNHGNPNQFVPSTIPVQGESGWDGGDRVVLHAKGTRMSLELRRPVPWGSNLRIYSEFDFYDDSTSSSMKFRVRHFYGQAWNFLIGQTYSAFQDIDAFPDVVDYQGPNGIVNRRQPQLRFTLPLIDREANHFHLFASVEQPEGKLETDDFDFDEDAHVANRLPDGVLGFRWEGDWGHVQSAGLFRELSYESDDGPSDDVFGWGVTLAGALNLFEKDKFSAQVTYGEGIARYINDLSGESLDAAIVGTQLETIPVFAAMAGYTHHWSDHWRSTASGGYVHVDAPSMADGFTIDHTLYASGNLMWHPTISFRMGLEYLYGHKETYNGLEEDAHRVNFVLRYDLVR